MYLKEIKFLIVDSDYRYCYCACKDCDCNCVYYRIDCDKHCIDFECDCDDIYNLVSLRNEEYYGEKCEEKYEENYVGESIICKYHKLIDLLNKRILIEYYIRNRNKFQFYNTEKNHRRYRIRINDMMKRMLDSSDSD